MSWTEDMRGAISAWRKHANALKKIRQIAEQRPAAAAFAFDLAAEELMRRGLIDFYYYGVAMPQSRYARKLERIEDQETEASRESLFYETYYHDPKRYEELAARGVFDVPKAKEELLRKGPVLTSDEELAATLAAVQHQTYAAAGALIDAAGERSQKAGYGFYGAAVCEAYLGASERMPVAFAGKIQEKWGGHPETRRRAAQSLAGWVASRTSLGANPALKAALDNVEGSSPFSQLLEALPGAVAVEWAKLGQDEPLSVLVTRTAGRLVREGDDATKPWRQNKLVSEGLDHESGAEDSDLEEFVMREELRALGEAAGLSEREHQVMIFAYEKEATNPDIADKLGISVNSVKTHRLRAMRKLREANGQ